MTELDKLCEHMRYIRDKYRTKAWDFSEGEDERLCNRTRADLLEQLLQEAHFIKTENKKTNENDEQFIKDLQETYMGC